MFLLLKVYTIGTMQPRILQLKKTFHQRFPPSLELIIFFKDFVTSMNKRNYSFVKVFRLFQSRFISIVYLHLRQIFGGKWHFQTRNKSTIFRLFFKVYFSRIHQFCAMLFIFIFCSCNIYIFIHSLTTLNDKSYKKSRYIF